MKLSEILGWEKKRSENQEMVGVTNASLNSVVNTALTSCDREIDREALEEILLKPSKSQENNVNFGVVNGYKARYLADAIISTMPTWLKRIEK